MHQLITHSITGGLPVWPLQSMSCTDIFEVRCIYHTYNSTMEEAMDIFESNCVDLDTFTLVHIRSLSVEQYFDIVQCSTSCGTINLFTNHTPGKHILTTSPAQQSIDIESPSFTGKYFQVMPVFGDLSPRLSLPQLACPTAHCSSHSLHTTSLSRYSRFSISTQTSTSPLVWDRCVDQCIRCNTSTFPPYQIINFSVLEGWTSFHLSLHWLLADFWSRLRYLVSRTCFCASYTSMKVWIDFPLPGKMSSSILQLV